MFLFKVVLAIFPFFNLLGEPVLSLTPPPDFSLKAEVAAVLPLIQDQVLLLQRVPTHPQANLWCSPGGKMIPGETPSIAAARELKEETDIEVDATALISLGKFYVRYPNGDYIFHLFKTHLLSLPEVKIDPQEHQSYCLCPLQDVSSLALTPGLDECIELALKP